MEKYQNKSYNGLSFDTLKQFLDAKVKQYNRIEFIESDPIQVPHLFSKKEDIEISGFLTAVISWGNRKSILKNANSMMDLLDQAPYQFVMQHSENDLERLEAFVHRTFNGRDFIYFIKALQHIYREHEGLENIFSNHSTEKSLQPAIHVFKNKFFDYTDGNTSKRIVSHLISSINDFQAKEI